MLNPINIIHDHGLWLSNNKCAFDVCRRFGMPLVISPRGMLEPWARKYRWWKKAPIWWLWQKAAVESAALLHATANTEADNLRALGLKNPIAVVPNGIELPELVAGHGSQPQRTVLFLSRIHPKKGLVNLIKAWRELQPDGWRLVIAGPDEGGHRAEVEKNIAAAGLSDQIVLVGPVEGAAKQELFAHSSLFVLPTFSENFGIVVAEALGAGVPVITTKGTPWSELSHHNCGWWIDIGVEPLVKALGEATALSDEKLRSMGQRGRQLIQDKYSWDKIAKDMESAYRWVLEGGQPPDCVRFD